MTRGAEARFHSAAEAVTADATAASSQQDDTLTFLPELHCRPHPGDRACCLVARRDVLHRKVRQCAINHVKIRRADPGGPDADEHLARSRLRHWDILYCQLAAGTVKARRTHGGLCHYYLHILG